MGYLDAFPAGALPSPPASSSSTGASNVPLRQERAHCWAARDGFFACLDAHGMVDSIGTEEARRKAEQNCGKEDKVFHRDCVTSWVKYFKERRIMEHKKALQLRGLEQEGAKPIGQTLPPSIGAAAAGGGKK